jgi:hypothetical protein
MVEPIDLLEPKTVGTLVPTAEGCAGIILPSMNGWNWLGLMLLYIVVPAKIGFVGIRSDTFFDLRQEI